jgi:hypothetical protein
MRRLKDAIYTLPHYNDQKHLRRIWKLPKKTITKGQAAWTDYMLSLWGRCLGGNEAPQCQISVIGRLMIRTKWSENRANQIIGVVNRLYEEGLRGEELYRKSRELIIPSSSTANIIALAKDSDDAAFVEKVMTKAINRDSPFRDVAIKRYCERKCPQDIARMIQHVTGYDIQYARKRVVWCETILKEEMYYALRRELESENCDIAA